MAKVPLTIEEIMAILPETPDRLAMLTQPLPPALLQAAPAPGSWSVNDVLAHLRACHDVLGGNTLRILSEDQPAWKGMSPRAWLPKTDYQTWAFHPALAAFTRQRADLLTVLEPLTAKDWERTATVTGMVGETYHYSARYYAAWMARHERGHLKKLPGLMSLVQELDRAPRG